MRYLLVLFALILSSNPVPAQAHWPSFRGPNASGVAEGQNTPTAWNVETGENVLWRKPIPGLGLSSPIIWGDHLYVTTAVSEKGDADLKIGLYGEIEPADDKGVQSWRIYCLDRKTGSILWQQVAYEAAPKTQRHTKASHANSTPVTDGEHVVAHFGSEGLYAWDHSGKLLWKKDFGKLISSFFQVPSAEWGYASSPTIHGDRLLVLHDVVGESSLIALDLKTGAILWQVKRDDVPTWGSPAVVQTSGRTQVVVNGFQHMGGYDLATGKELWKMSGGGDIPVPTPIFANGLIYFASAHGGASPLIAVRPDATGDITLKEGETANAYVAWLQKKVGVYLQTPLAYGDDIYAGRGNGALQVFNAKTGKLRYKKRLASSKSFTASPVAAGGKVYFTAETGDVHVIEAGASELNTLAVNELGEVTMATPAIAEDTLFFRSRRHVIAIGHKAAVPAPAKSAKAEKADTRH